MQSPIFIFSLPRSGSTLLQRVLMSNKDICSVAEPWLLLPQMYLLKEEGTIAEYSSLTGTRGINDFINNLPNKEDDYFKDLRVFISSLYSKQCKNNERYFIDKTPRYYLIIDEIVKLFPDAKFIFLFRNPIHVYASIINTWGNKRFNKFYSTYYDLTIGFKKLSAGYRKHKNSSIFVRYEDFVSNPEEELKKISNYLDILIKPEVLQEFSKQDIKGNLGDPTGVIEYSSISVDGLEKWKTTFNSVVRKKFARHILKKIDTDDCTTQGYNRNQIINEVGQLNNKQNTKTFIDLFDYFTSYLVRKKQLNIVFDKNFHWVKRRFLS